jgi:hypothetical protein
LRQNYLLLLTLKRRRQFLPMPEGRGILAEIGDEPF